MLNSIKQKYWSALARFERWRNPSDVVLNPHDWLEAVAYQVGGDDRLVLVDGGAHDGRMIEAFSQRFGNLEAYGFEPNNDLHADLEAVVAAVGGKTIGAALGSASGETEMNINASPMTSSVLARNENSVRYFDEVTRLAERRTVPMLSLDDWARQEGVERIDVLKLDLQGYELEALRGATEMLRRGIGCVFTEVNFVPHYEGSAVFGDIDAFMRSHGYRLFNLYNLSTKTADGQLNGGDAMYIRDAAPVAALQEAA